MLRMFSRKWANMTETDVSPLEKQQRGGQAVTVNLLIAFSFLVFLQRFEHSQWKETEVYPDPFCFFLNIIHQPRQAGSGAKDEMKALNPRKLN